jgi:hypothetical protein
LTTGKEGGSVKCYYEVDCDDGSRKGPGSMARISIAQRDLKSFFERKYATRLPIITATRVAIEDIIRLFFIELKNLGLLKISM